MKTVAATLLCPCCGNKPGLSRFGSSEQGLAGLLHSKADGFVSMTARLERGPPGAAALQPFSAPYAPADEELAAQFLAAAPRPAVSEEKIDALATRLIEAIRAQSGGLGGIEDFLHAYSLSTKEGLALMVLAEALLRVPDAATTDRLIEDKLSAGNWQLDDDKTTALLVSASAWALGLGARVIHPGETPEN